MSFATATCPAISEDLDKALALDCLKRTSIGALDSILSDVNRANLLPIPFDQNNGHKRIVDLRFLPYLDPLTALTTRQDICVAGAKVEPEVMSVNVTQIISSATVPISMDDMSKLCVDFNYTYQLFGSLLDQVNAALDMKILLALVSPATRYWNSLDTSRDYDVLKNDGSANAPGFVKFINDYQESGCSDKPIVIGNGNLQNMFLLGKYGCCNSTQGFDVQRTDELGYFYRDTFAGQILGANNFIGYMPGAVQLVTFNIYKGMNIVEQDSLKLGTIDDPRTGLTWNLRMKLNECGTALPVWNMNLELEYEIVKLPTNVFPAGTVGEGVNGIFRGVALQLP